MTTENEKCPPINKHYGNQGKVGEDQNLYDQHNGVKNAIEELKAQMLTIQKKIIECENPANTTMDFKKLMRLKKDRKKFESDAQLLANRIELLKKEELKIWKKIEEYHRKANEIFDLKNKNKERQDEKHRNENKRKKARDCKATDGQTVRKKREEAKRLKIELLERTKKRMFEKIKSEQKLNELKHNQMKERLKEQRRQMTAEIRYNQSIGRLRLHKFEEDKQLAISKRIQSEEKQEKNFIGKIKRELNSMCKMEGDWITKLKSSQVIQTQAFEKQKNVLILSTDDFHNQYNEDKQYHLINFTV